MLTEWNKFQIKAWLRRWTWIKTCNRFLVEDHSYHRGSRKYVLWKERKANVDGVSKGKDEEMMLGKWGRGPLWDFAKTQVFALNGTGPTAGF